MICHYVNGLTYIHFNHRLALDLIVCQWNHASGICLNCQLTHIVNQSVGWNLFRWMLETTPSYPFNRFSHRFSKCGTKNIEWGPVHSTLCLLRGIHAKICLVICVAKNGRAGKMARATSGTHVAPNQIRQINNYS